jgi:hypothetical protein
LRARALSLWAPRQMAQLQPSFQRAVLPCAAWDRGPGFLCVTGILELLKCPWGLGEHSLANPPVNYERRHARAEAACRSDPTSSRHER